LHRNKFYPRPVDSSLIPESVAPDIGSSQGKRAGTQPRPVRPRLSRTGYIGVFDSTVSPRLSGAADPDVSARSPVVNTHRSPLAERPLPVLGLLVALLSAVVYTVGLSVEQRALHGS